MIKRKEYYNVGVFGNGQIGSVIREMLQENRYFNVRCYDKISTDAGVTELDAFDDEAVMECVKNNDIIVSALPFDVTKTIAACVALAGDRVYLDLTEDVFAASELIGFNKHSNKGSIMIPHCGLAPGAVSMIAASLSKKFDEVTDIRMMVGALPITANNALKYHLSWSTSGLVNEYANACPSILYGEYTWLKPLEDYKQVVIDGTTYEAFNTSGGLGTLGDSIINKRLLGIKCNPSVNVSYQTLRYPGHRDLMKFLLDDLNFKWGHKRTQLVSILDENLPRSTNDVIVISVTATGTKNNSTSLSLEVYQRKIYSNARFSAIQLTTAGGVCAVINWIEKALVNETLADYVNDDWTIRCESLPLSDVEDYEYWPF